MAEDRDARVEAAARAAVKEFQRQGAEYTPYVDLRDEADPSAFLIDGDVDLVQLAKAMLAAADAVSGTAGWIRENSLIYSLRQDGWERGKPNLANDVMIRVTRSHQSTTDLEPIMAAILRALPPPPERGDG